MVGAGPGLIGRRDGVDRARQEAQPALHGNVEYHIVVAAAAAYGDHAHYSGLPGDHSASSAQVPMAANVPIRFAIEPSGSRIPI
jgi:hypothetical protein